jgi:hypothetical protein
MIQLGNAPVYVAHNFISDEDAEAAISLITEQVKDLGRNGIQLSKIAGYQVCTPTPVVHDFLCEFGAKSSALHNLDVDLFTKSANLGLWQTGSRCLPHTDDALEWTKMLSHSSVIYLNDDYEGGSIGFPEYGEYYRPKKGDCIIFNASIVHEVLPITGGIRYTAAFWHTEDKQYKDKYDKV